MGYVLQQSDSNGGDASNAAWASVHNGTYLYVIKDQFASGALEVYSYNESTDIFSLVEYFFIGLSGISSVRDIIYNGKYLIVAGDSDIGVFEHSLGSLTKKDEISHGLSGDPKLATDGNYVYAITGLDTEVQAFRVDENGIISYIAQRSFSYRTGSLSADANYVYVNEHNSSANSNMRFNVLSFNGVSFSTVTTFLQSAAINGGVIPCGVNRVAICKINSLGAGTTYLYNTTNWSQLDSLSLAIDELEFDGTYVIGVKYGTNQICTVSVDNDELAINSVVSYSGGNDPFDVSWWKNKIFTCDGIERNIRSYKNAVTGIASVSPLVAKAPATITFSVS